MSVQTVFSSSSKYLYLNIASFILHSSSLFFLLLIPLLHLATTASCNSAFRTNVNAEDYS